MVSSVNLYYIRYEDGTLALMWAKNSKCLKNISKNITDLDIIDYGLVNIREGYFWVVSEMETIDFGPKYRHIGKEEQYDVLKYLKTG